MNNREEFNSDKDDNGGGNCCAVYLASESALFDKLISNKSSRHLRVD